MTLAATSAMFAGICAAQTTQPTKTEVQQKKYIELRAAAGAGGGSGGGFGGQMMPKVAVRYAPARKEKAAYLGVVTAPVTAVLREQLKLKPGVGLVVESVQKDSPAEAAGFKQYDVIEKLDDQWLINSQQFAVLVRMHQPGEEVTVSLIRQGQSQNIKAKLVEKELAVIDETNAWGVPGANPFENFVAPQGTMTFKGPMEVSDLEGTVLDNPPAGQNMSMNVSDDQHTLVLNIHDGKKHLLATDKEGNIVFNGPIDTEEQRKAMPEEIAKKLEKLESKPNMIRLRSGGLLTPTPPTPPTPPTEQPAKQR